MFNKLKQKYIEFKDKKCEEDLKKSLANNPTLCDRAIIQNELNWLGKFKTY